MSAGEKIKEEVRKRYGSAAKQARQGGEASCCGSDDTNVISSRLYTTDELHDLPQEAVLASLGCANPVAVADLREGETVLDLGSGGGIDVLLSARRVGPSGKAYGLDMTDEMLELARENARKAGVSNVEFVKGEMEEMPLPDGEIDVIISNCVVNLSPDKDRVLREAFRVLKPGGRIAIADIVTRGRMPAELQRSLELWAGCVAGALTEDDYRAKLEVAGFEEISIEAVREYTAEDAESGGLGDLMRRHAKAGAEGLGIFSAIVRAKKSGSGQSTVNSGQARHPAHDDEPVTVVSSGKSAGGCGPGCC